MGPKLSKFKENKKANKKWDLIRMRERKREREGEREREREREREKGMGDLGDQEGS